MKSVAADIRRCCPGVRLRHSSSLRFVCQLYADDLVILADSAADLQLGLDAVTKWGRTWVRNHGVWSVAASALLLSHVGRH